MSFVGTRPEAVKYVEKYKPEYFARDSGFCRVCAANRRVLCRKPGSGAAAAARILRERGKRTGCR